MELSSIRPELAPTFKTEDTKLGEEELNILMAHAYWKIITLQKELARQQVKNVFFICVLNSIKTKQKKINSRASSNVLKVP